MSKIKKGDYVKTKNNIIGSVDKIVEGYIGVSLFQKDLSYRSLDFSWYDMSEINKIDKNSLEAIWYEARLLVTKLSGFINIKSVNRELDRIEASILELGDE